jgi:hypothetical protein
MLSSPPEKKRRLEAAVLEEPVQPSVEAAVEQAVHAPIQAVETPVEEVEEPVEAVKTSKAPLFEFCKSQIPDALAKPSRGDIIGLDMTDSQQQLFGGTPPLRGQTVSFTYSVNVEVRDISQGVLRGKDGNKYHFRNMQNFALQTPRLIDMGVLSYETVQAKRMSEASENTDL